MYVLRNLIIPTKKLQARNSGTARFLMQSPIEIYEAFIDKARKRRNHDTLDMIGLSQHFSKYNRVWWKLNQAVCYGFQRQCFVSVVFCDVKHRILLFFFQLEMFEEQQTMKLRKDYFLWAIRKKMYSFDIFWKKMDFSCIMKFEFAISYNRMCKYLKYIRPIETNLRHFKQSKPKTQILDTFLVKAISIEIQRIH